MQSTHTRHLRLGFGLLAMVAVMALVVVLATMGSNGGTTSVSATGPTPTTEPNPGTDGILSAVYDLEVIPGVGIYTCILRNDHDATTNRLKVAAVCNADFDAGDPANVLSGVNVPGEGPTAGAGPAPPPPYTQAQPNQGVGQYYPGGHADCANVGSGTCSVTVTCFEELGAGSLGPNTLSKTVLTDPDVTPDVQAGTLYLKTGVSNADCAKLEAADFTGAPALAFSLFEPGTAGEVSWRTALGASATDFDGDGCTDFDELDTKGTRPKGCGDDPYSPLDSNQTNYSGSYSILVRVTRSDLGAGGAYFSCLADIQQDGNGKDAGLVTPGLTARAFCYTDSSLGVNLIGYPGVTGDGFPGGGPAWGAIPADGAPETICTRFGAADEDADTVVNDGCPSQGFGDTDPTQTELYGYVDNADNTLKLRGCFKDPDASSNLQNVYVEVEVNAATGQGGGSLPEDGVNIWALQTLAECDAGYAYGDYATTHGAPLPAFTNVEFSIARQPGGKDRDTDQDGASNAEELRDDATNQTTGLGCGLRDPYNPYDWYDVNSDGVIDLLTDILGVIQHYQPAAGGAPPYDILYDRPSPITGGAGSWSRGAPDGVIDLLNDILGVIQQYHPAPC